MQKYLVACLKSVLQQSNTDYEIILIDDGSTDGSEKICDEYVNKYPLKIRCIHQKNAGLSEARNAGIKNANGMYLIFLDSDDMLADKALSNLKNVIEVENYPEVLISRVESIINDNENEVIPCEYTFNSDRLKYLSSSEVFLEIHKLTHHSLLGAWSFSPSIEYIYRKGLYFYPNILHEDEEWIPRVILNSEHIGFNNTILYRYRINRFGSITATQDIKRLFDKIKVTNLLKSEFEKYPKCYRDVVCQRICSIILGVLCSASNFLGHDRYEELKKQIRNSCKKLKKSDKFIHRFAGLCSQILGITATSFLLDRYSKLKNIKVLFHNKNLSSQFI